MLTFDDNHKPAGIAELFGTHVPDLVECGENNAVWYQVLRSKHELQIVNKVDGKIKRVPIDGDFTVIASSYGLGPRQIGAVFAALRL
jgi:hypothetical protein